MQVPYGGNVKERGSTDVSLMPHPSVFQMWKMPYRDLISIMQRGSPCTRQEKETSPNCRLGQNKSNYCENFWRILKTSNAPTFIVFVPPSVSDSVRSKTLKKRICDLLTLGQKRKQRRLYLNYIYSLESESSQREGRESTTSLRSGIHERPWEGLLGMEQWTQEFYPKEIPYWLSPDD